MITLEIKGKKYELKYGHRVLVENKLISRILDAQMATAGKLAAEEEEESLDTKYETFCTGMEKTGELVIDLVLAGLQRDYEEFKYNHEDPADKKEKYDKAADLLDDYSEEGGNLLALYGMINGELEKKGFMADVTKAIIKMAEEAEKEAKRLKASSAQKK